MAPSGHFAVNTHSLGTSERQTIPPQIPTKFIEVTDEQIVVMVPLARRRVVPTRSIRDLPPDFQSPVFGS
jgi:hypothetical protein